MSETNSAPAPTATGNESTAAEQSSQTSEIQESKALPQALKEKFKFTVDGQDFEEEIDYSNKEDLKKRFQLGHAAQKRMAEAVSARKQAMDIVKAFEENPENMLSRLGPKGREIAEKFLLAQIQDEMLSPEEKEKRDLKRYKEQNEAEKAKEKEKEAKSALEKKQAELATHYQTKFISALEKSGLPKTPEMVKRMAQMESKNLDYGLELTPEELAAEVKKEIISLVKFVAGDADGDQLINLFGEDISKKIRQSDIKKLQDMQSKVFQSGQKVSQSATTPQEKPVQTIEQWKDDLNKRFSK